MTSCQKEESVNVNRDASAEKAPAAVNQVNTITPVPASFSKKVLVEEFVGTQYAQTPEANYDLAQIVKSSNNHVYSASLHVGDAMNSNQTSILLSSMPVTPTSYPCGMIDRAHVNGNLYTDSKQFTNAVNMRLNSSVDCGLAISSVMVSGQAQVDIYTGFSAPMTGNYKVNAYLVEDRVSGNNPNFYQSNAYNLTFGSPFYLAGNPISTYEHQNVVRKSITNPAGNPISATAMVAGGQEIHSFTVDLPVRLCNISNYHIIAYITNVNTNEIVNVQQAQLGMVKDWN